MRDITASDAKNRFGELLDTVQGEPVVIRRNGRDVAVVVSAAEFARLREGAGGGQAVPSERVKALHAESARRYASVYEALAR